METLDHLDRERGQTKPPRRSMKARMLRRVLRVLLVLGPVLAKLVQVGFEIFKARE
jgi:hypothetical protein